MRERRQATVRHERFMGAVVHQNLGVVALMASLRGVLLRWRMAKQEYRFRYRLCNWSAYNRALINRGRLTPLVRRTRRLGMVEHRSRQQARRAKDLLGHGNPVRPGVERRKLHLGIDESTEEIVAVEVTPSGANDSGVLPTLLDQVPGQIGKVSGGRGCDKSSCYQAVMNRGDAPAILPRRNARLSGGEPPPAWRRRRDAAWTQIMAVGRCAWRVRSGYKRQSLAENAVSRFKALLGPKLSARPFNNQRTEAMVTCAALNRMTHLGMPQSVRVH